MDNQPQTQKFYVGPRGVETVVIEDIKTYGGNDVVMVHYEGGYKELMTKKVYELVSSTTPSDFTAVRNKKFQAMQEGFNPVIVKYYSTKIDSDESAKTARITFLQEGLAAISEYDIKSSEIEPFFNSINAEMAGLVNGIIFELDNNFNRATNFLWVKNDSDFIPGTNMMMERTLLESKKIIQEIPVKVEEPKKDEGVSQ